jgi:hypothetical protein
VERLVSQLGDSEEFAAQFDEAVMREDRDRILGLIKEAGVSDEVEVSIVELDADRMIQIKFCIWVVCISITFSWRTSGPTRHAIRTSPLPLARERQGRSASSRRSPCRRHRRASQALHGDLYDALS